LIFSLTALRSSSRFFLPGSLALRLCADDPRLPEETDELEDLDDDFILSFAFSVLLAGSLADAIRRLPDAATPTPEPSNITRLFFIKNQHKPSKSTKSSATNDARIMRNQLSLSTAVEWRSSR